MDQGTRWVAKDDRAKANHWTDMDMTALKIGLFYIVDSLLLAYELS